MFLFNLSLPEFVALLGVTSSVVVALYLLSRSRLRRKVATLRFWNAALRPESSRQRRRIQQPWSLLLQLLALACLILAIAQPRLGSRENGPRDHVLILDNSSWMAAGSKDRTLMDEAKESARKWLRPPAALRSRPAGARRRPALSRDRHDRRPGVGCQSRGRLATGSRRARRRPGHGLRPSVATVQRSRRKKSAASGGRSSRSRNGKPWLG